MTLLPLGLPPKPTPGPSPPCSLGASCFGDRPSRSREFTANPHPGLSVGSASREVRGRPSHPGWRGISGHHHSQVQTPTGSVRGG